MRRALGGQVSPFSFPTGWGEPRPPLFNIPRGLGSQVGSPDHPRGSPLPSPALRSLAAGPRCSGGRLGRLPEQGPVAGSHHGGGGKSLYQPTARVVKSSSSSSTRAIPPQTASVPSARSSPTITCGARDTVVQIRPTPLTGPETEPGVTVCLIHLRVLEVHLLKWLKSHQMLLDDGFFPPVLLFLSSAPSLSPSLEGFDPTL